MTRRKTSTRVDGEITRQRILDAAGKLFAINGFAETTSKSIAMEADVDLASINYHFGSRNGLYQNVLAAAHSSIINIEKLNQITQNEQLAQEKLRAFIELLCNATRSGHEWQAQTLAREILAPTSNLAVLFQKELEPKLMIIRELLSEVTGIPSDAPQLAPCMLNVIAPCMVLLVAGQSVPGAMQETANLPQEQLIEHMYHFALSGLLAMGEHYRLTHLQQA